MTRDHRYLLALAGIALTLSCSSGPGGGSKSPLGLELGDEPKLKGWLDWRGPDQNGTSLETGLVDTVTLDGENHLWSYDLSGRGAPVIAGGRLYCLGYSGTGPELREQMDHKVFVHAPDDIRLIRRIRRDVAERGRDVAEVLEQYLKTVRPMHQAFVAPSQAHADLVVDGTTTTEAMVSAVMGLLAL